MSTATPVQVELTVQDYFFGTEESAEPPLVESEVQSDRQVDRGESPIAIATWHQWFQQWMEQLNPEFAATQDSATQEYELSLRLTDDAEMQTLNAQYRQIDQPTDVLAFAALETDYPELDELAATPLYLGDVVISVETAQQQAIAQQHSLAYELAWLAAHGLLHLLGWDHPDDEQLSQMLHQQQVLLQLVGLES
jgi:probable rRNA maturation factor